MPAQAAAPVQIVSNAPPSDWTGFYGGVQLEAIVIGDFTSPFPVTGDYSGSQLAGLFVGYRYDLGNVVLGAEFDYVTGPIEVALSIGGVVDVDFDYLMRFGAEIGYDVGDTLLYATAGVASLQTSLITGTDSNYGIFYGLGFDYALPTRSRYERRFSIKSSTIFRSSPLTIMKL